MTKEKDKIVPYLCLQSDGKIRTTTMRDGNEDDQKKYRARVPTSCNIGLGTKVLLHDRSLPAAF